MPGVFKHLCACGVRASTCTTEVSHICDSYSSSICGHDLDCWPSVLSAVSFRCVYCAYAVVLQPERSDENTIFDAKRLLGRPFNDPEARPLHHHMWLVTRLLQSCAQLPVTVGLHSSANSHGQQQWHDGRVKVQVPALQVAEDLEKWPFHVEPDAEGLPKYRGALPLHPHFASALPGSPRQLCTLPHCAVPARRLRIPLSPQATTVAVQALLAAWYLPCGA